MMAQLGRSEARKGGIRLRFGLEIMVGCARVCARVALRLRCSVAAGPAQDRIVKLSLERGKGFFSRGKVICVTARL